MILHCHFGCCRKRGKRLRPNGDSLCKQCADNGFSVRDGHRTADSRKVLQKERRFPDSFFEIGVIGPDRRIAEIAAVVLEQLIGHRETECPQIFDGKDRRGAGIALDPVYPKPRFSATKKAARAGCPCVPSTRCAAAGYGVSPETVRISFQETDCHVLPSLISLLLLSSRYSTVSAG